MSLFSRIAAGLAGAFLLAAPAAAIDVQVVKSPGGIEAWLVEEHGLPIISLDAGFDGGARIDPAGKAGLAYLTAVLMNEGAGEFDSTAFSQKMDDKAISLGGNADQDAFYLSLNTLSANKADAFELLRLAIASPRFDQEAIDRMKAQIIAGIKEQDQDPSAIAGNAWQTGAFPGHPYGLKVGGTVESVTAITRDDIVGFMTQALGRDKLKVVVVGDITAAELGPLLDTLFATVPATRALADPPAITMQNTGKTQIVDMDIPQSVIQFGAPGLKATDPDFRAAQVLNYVLGGGGFASRMMKEIRAKRGLTYGVSTGFATPRLAEYFFGGLATDNKTAGQAFDLVKEEIQKFRDGGITDEELADAKAYLTGSFALRFDSNANISNILLSYFLSGFGKDYINTRNPEIEAVTKDQVNAAAKRLLDPAQLYTVVVGKPVGVTATP